MKQFKSVLAASALLVSAFGGSSLQATIAGTFGAIGSEFDGTDPEVRVIDGSSGAGVAGAFDDMADINAVEWSSSGGFLLAGGAVDIGVHIHVYSFDGTTFTEEDSISNGALVRDVAWKKSEDFFATVESSTDLLQTFSFDGASIASVDSINIVTEDGIDPRTVDWHPDGGFIAVGGFNDSGDELAVYAVDGAGTIDATSKDTEPHGARVDDVKWSPDGNFLAIGGRIGTDSFTVRVFAWDGSTTLTLKDSKTTGLGVSVESVDWSPDGTLLAVGRGDGTVEVFSVDGAGLLASLATLIFTGIEVHGVSWYPDGENILAGGAVASAPDTGRYVSLAFDGASFTGTNWTVDQDPPVNSVDVRPEQVVEGKGGCDCEIDDCLVTSFRGNFAVDPCRKLLANFIDPVRLNGTTGKFEQDDDTESITCFSGNVGVGECRTLLTNRICPVVDIEISDKCTVCDADDRGCEENAAGCLELCGDQVIIQGKLLVNEFGPFDEGCLTKDGVRTAPAPMRFAGDVDVAGNVLTGGVNLGELVADMQLEIARLKALLKN